MEHHSKLIYTNKYVFNNKENTPKQLKHPFYVTKIMWIQFKFGMMIYRHWSKTYRHHLDSCLWLSGLGHGLGYFYIFISVHQHLNPMLYFLIIFYHINGFIKAQFRRATMSGDLVFLLLNYYHKYLYYKRIHLSPRNGRDICFI